MMGMIMRHKSESMILLMQQLSMRLGTVSYGYSKSKSFGNSVWERGYHARMRAKRSRSQICYGHMIAENATKRNYGQWEQERSK
jgi:hypothetical protein